MLNNLSPLSNSTSESEVMLNPHDAFSDVGYLSCALITVESPIIVQIAKIRSTVILPATSKMLTWLQ